MYFNKMAKCCSYIYQHTLVVIYQSKRADICSHIYMASQNLLYHVLHYTACEIFVEEIGMRAWFMGSNDDVINQQRKVPTAAKQLCQSIDLCCCYFCFGQGA